MIDKFLAFLLAACFACSGWAESVMPSSYKSLTYTLYEAKSNGIKYDTWVSVPPGYENSNADYPILILLDGGYFMGTTVEAAHIQAMTGEAKPIIVAGITTHGPTHGLQRLIDYSAEVPSLDVPPGAEVSFWQLIADGLAKGGIKHEDAYGGTGPFLSFLENEWLPDLAKRYRVDPTDIGIAGHSSGGEFVVDTLLKKQTAFSKFIVGSYGVHVFADTLPEREQYFAKAKALRPLQVFCGFGGGEIEDPDLIDYIGGGVALMKRLQKLDPENVSINVRGFEHEQHGSVFHHILSSGIHELWGTGKTLTETMKH